MSTALGCPSEPLCLLDLGASQTFSLKEVHTIVDSHAQSLTLASDTKGTTMHTALEAGLDPLVTTECVGKLHH